VTFANTLASADAVIFRHLGDDAAVLDNVPITGVFRNAYSQSLGGIATKQPIFVARSTEVPRARQGSTLRLVGQADTYRVANIEPDGTGVTTLLLERQ